MRKKAVTIFAFAIVLLLSGCKLALAMQQSISQDVSTPVVQSSVRSLNNLSKSVWAVITETGTGIGDIPGRFYWLQNQKHQKQYSRNLSKAEDAEQVFSNTSNTGSAPNEDEYAENAMIDICITVGDSVFSAKLYDHDATRALLTLFPLTLNMSDLNGNEKYCNLTDALPAGSTEKPATINAGDIMCWSRNSLVLFYKTFSNSYGGYLRLGFIDDPSGFAMAVGNGNVQVSFTVD